jgi:triosephosphate isomerase (TIM)
MARVPIIAGNWKMNMTVQEAVSLVKQLIVSIQSVKGVDMVVAPPFTALDAVRKEIAGSLLCLGAQNVFWEEKGAFTGEVSPLMICEVGCEYVILGHSERRQFFGETDESVNRRIKAALGHNLKPVFCVGETLKEREGGNTFAVIERQIKGGLNGFGGKELDRITIAYEPVWAIGTGRTATPQQAQEVHRFIRQKVAERFGGDSGEKTRIQYGGSVTPENIKGLMELEDIDGALVGGASLKAESFSRIVRFKEI